MNLGKFSKYWVLQAAGWGSFALTNTFFAWSFDKFQTRASVEIFFGRLGIFILVGLLATHVMRFAIIRLNVMQRTFDRQVAQFLLMTFTFSILASFMYMRMLQYFHWLKKDEQEYADKNSFLLILSGGVSFFLLFFIWNLIYFMYHYVSKSRKQQMDTLQLEKLVKELELQTIKAHINPHFIFNALNSIRALIDENPERARTAVTELSNILRSSLRAEKGETVQLNDELRIVKDYLALEHIRFEDRLHVEYQVDEQTLQCEVPPMMLQTLVENAIKHGISRQVRGGVVRIRSDFHDRYYELTVQNTGNLNRDTDNGFGISSTQDRLALLYGDRAHFHIRQIADDLVEARVEIPVGVEKSFEKV
ncbi:sensor histidine kinase [Flaviaesturariibacter flavus]|uniref:Sensor histidine kinase n=1 Tax=Flaviaesturariibacter flavus TaxID=2502780 RepID=A0A4R1BBG3_9BACT|nr:histidine kinase [Flaviaesturariibacter flavus]TCJ14346.1 sensor histidine kinase [Flaviaesturariibacter flavus]